MLSNKNITRSVLLLLFAGLLSACGFHLRESVTLPESFQSTAILGVTEFSDLDMALKRNFSFAGISLQEKENAQVLLKVTKNAFSRKVLSVDTAGNANEYELGYRLTFSLLDSNKKEILPANTIRLFRTYHFNPDVRLAKEAEEKYLKKSMVNDAARQVMRRISIALKK